MVAFTNQKSKVKDHPLELLEANQTAHIKTSNPKAKKINLYCFQTLSVFCFSNKRKLIQNDIGLNITNACQLKCKHCFRQEEPRTNTHMSYEEFLYTLEFYDKFITKFVHYNPRNHNKINVAFIVDMYLSCCLS